MTRKQSDGSARHGTARGFFVKLTVVLAAVLVGLLIAEIFLRAVGYTYPVFYTPDPDLGYVLRPGVEGWYRKEGAAYVRVNSDGLRDREHVKEKPPGTIRIAVVGDSYAEALQVAQDAAFWSLMEQRLQGCGAFAGRTVEVINFGVSGYGTAQELITLRKKVWDYSPDIVLVAFTTNNDITDNSRALKRTDEVPYFVLRDGQLVLDDAFRTSRSFVLRQSALNRAGRWVRDHLRVIQAMHQGHGAIKSAIATWRAKRDAPAPGRDAAAPQDSAARARGAQSPAAPADELGVDNLVYREPSGAVWEDAWRVTEKLIVEMRDEVKNRGAKFLVVTLSNAIQSHPDAAARAAFMRRLGVETLLYPDLRLKALGEREGFNVINLAPDLQAHAEQNKIFLHGFGREIGNGHWNEAGHKVAGELLARRLCNGAAQ